MRIFISMFRLITDAVDVLLGYVSDVVQTERVVFMTEVQLQIVETVIVIDRHTHLKHLGKKKTNRISN